MLRPQGRVPRHRATVAAVVHLDGEYLVIEPPSLLSFTWISEGTDQKPTVVTIEFLERGAGTELVLTHRQLSAKAIEGHRGGWTDAVRVLEEFLTKG